MLNKQEEILQNIIKNLTDNTLVKDNVIEILLSLIENSDYEDIRKHSLEILMRLKRKNLIIYNLIEKCLISDESPAVRATAAKFLILEFPKICKKSVQWALKRETSPFVIKTIQNLSYGVDGHKLEFFSE